jgi:RNA polymerase sigma-70 factor (ECF subfamily)
LQATRTVSLDDDETVLTTTDSGTPEAIVIERSNQALVQDAIAELPVKFREILLLCEMEEMTYQEIAATLSVPVGTVMSRLARARAALREVLRQKLRKS